MEHKSNHQLVPIELGSSPAATAVADPLIEPSHILSKSQGSLVSP